MMSAGNVTDTGTDGGGSLGGDGGDDESLNEYVNARKLVARASKREAILTGSGKGSGSDKGGVGGVGGGGTLGGSDFSNMRLKGDHVDRPCWTCPDGSIYLEAFHSLYLAAYDFLVAIAEPVARPEHIHEYRLTPYSLYAAVATNISTQAICRVLDRLSKNEVPGSVIRFVKECTQRYGKAKLVLKHNRFLVESEHPVVLRELLRDPAISQARVSGGACGSTTGDDDGFLVQAAAQEMDENLHAGLVGDNESDDEMELPAASSREGGGGGEGGDEAVPRLTTVAFQIKSESVEVVKKQAIELDYPLMEEYDFRNDRTNPDIPMMDLKPNTRIRRYQERSLSKMFGNGRARSGIIVLPCGAGKTLTGVTAAQTIKKSCVCLCTNAVSVHQWKYQFQLWTNIPDDRISCFTSDQKQPLHPEACVLVTTYTMVSYGGKRSAQSEEVMKAIKSREWGLMLMDEVHVVPAKMFRRVVGSVAAHCRLGLTATLVREDDLISDLNFLIGPKLYEANWMDLTAQGYLANVQCIEVWCPMTGPFMEEYLSAKNARLKQLLYVMNPSKIRSVEYLVRFHEARGDKIIVFSDLVFSLKFYAETLGRACIYGETSERERQAILGTFRTDDSMRTICISKVGDTSIDLPEANVIVQVSSHFGSRRQEAQRLGRILRPKSYTQTDGTNRTSPFNAFFYTLVSTDTQEMFYSAKRQQYLIDQGYTFKIVDDLHLHAAEEARKEKYKYHSPETDLGLLRELLTRDQNREFEQQQRAEDSAIRNNNKDGAALADAGVKRTAGSLAHLSGGGSSRSYRELMMGPGTGKRHPLFQKRFRR